MIVAAAIRINSAVISMAQPARHHDIQRQIAGLYAPDDRPAWTHEEEVQGFITHSGEFLDRKQAYKHAVDCGQGLPRREARLAAGHSTDYCGPELYSEDLW